MSVNHQFVEYEDTIFARYRKTAICAVAGIRINPAKPGERMSFVLQSKFKNFDQDTKQVTFSYDDDVVELYSEQEAKVFKRLNPYLFSAGLITEYNLEKPEVPDNTLSEDEVQHIVTLPLADFRERLDTITAVQPVRRIKDAIDSLSLPIAYRTMVEARLKELER
jgi:hypothetical protein